MRHMRFVLRPSANLPAQPFIDAEEAWFWYARCQRSRDELARNNHDGRRETRPCDPDDIYRQVMRLARRGSINRNHLNVLGRYGLEERPPDPRLRDEEREARLWDEALDRLTTPLKTKGIIQ